MCDAKESCALKKKGVNFFKNLSPSEHKQSAKVNCAYQRYLCSNPLCLQEKNICLQQCANLNLHNLCFFHRISMELIFQHKIKYFLQPIAVLNFCYNMLFLLKLILMPFFLNAFCKAGSRNFLLPIFFYPLSSFL